MPTNAIIVPSFNRTDKLKACLTSLVAQSADDFEIIVVDDGSPTPLDEVCASFGAAVRYVRQENSGPAIARNRGAAVADAEFLAFTDDDCKPRPDWLANLRARHAGCEMAMVGGRVENGVPDDRFAAASQALCDFLYDYYGASDGTMPFFTSNNIGLSRTGFERLGGFDESFRRAAAEDRDFGMRWKNLGGELLYAPDAVIDHFHTMTLSKYWRQHSNYGAGAYHLHRVMDARNEDRPKFEPVRFYAGLVAWPVRQNGLKGVDLSLLMALSQIAMVNGYGKARRAEGK